MPSNTLKTEKNRSNSARVQVKPASVAIKLIAMMYILKSPLPRPWLCALALVCTGAVAQQTEAQCDAMPSNTYASGMTDGAWFGFPGAGKTYFYRSACYMDLVRRTGRVELCAKVIQRRSLLGDGSGTSPAACERVAAQFKATQAQAQRDAETHAKLIQGVYVLSPLTAQTLPNGNWRLRTTALGTLAGEYRVELQRSRDNQRLRTQTLTLSKGQDFEWEVTRAEVVGTTPLPAIFPMAVSLYYQMPPNAQGRAYEHLSSIQNLTLSAQ
jgi:hypothetical protein